MDYPVVLLSSDSRRRDHSALVLPPGRSNRQHATNKSEKGVVSTLALAHLVARMWLKQQWYSQSLHDVLAVQQTRDLADEAVEDRWKALSQSVLELKIGHLHFQRWLSACNFSTMRDYQNSVLEAKYKAVFGEALTEAQFFEDLFNQHKNDKALEASLLSIKETQRGLKEQHAITRLTQMAFIFLPLTFITGVFGMNISPFGGDAPMWKFWATTWCILVPSWIIGLSTVREEIVAAINAALNNLAAYILIYTAFRTTRGKHQAQRTTSDKEGTEDSAAVDRRTTLPDPIDVEAG